MGSEWIAISSNGYGNNSSGNGKSFNGIRADSKTLLVENTSILIRNVINF